MTVGGIMGVLSALAADVEDEHNTVDLAAERSILAGAGTRINGHYALHRKSSQTLLPFSQADRAAKERCSV